MLHHPVPLFYALISVVCVPSDVDEDELFTAGRDVGEALVLASFPLAVADVEVHVDRRGESLVSIGRNLDEQ